MIILFSIIFQFDDMIQPFMNTKQERDHLGCHGNISSVIEDKPWLTSTSNSYVRSAFLLCMLFCWGELILPFTVFCQIYSNITFVREVFASLKFYHCLLFLLCLSFCLFLKGNDSIYLISLKLYVMLQALDFGF